MFVSYAQNFEDVLLWRALSHVEHGFYVDVGAQDPIIDSVSLAFYEHGWRGVHIEPVPTCASLLRQRRPDEVVIQALIGSTQGVRPFFELPESGLSTTDAGTAAKHKDAGFIVRETLVPCITLAKALAPFAGRDIHWLKIDVEGSEREVLEGWGSEAKPWIVVIESTVPLTQIESYQRWEPLILSLGYSFAYFDGLNRFYVSSEHVALVDSFRYGPSYFDGFVLSASTPYCTRLNSEIEDLRQRSLVAQEETERRDLKLKTVEAECEKWELKARETLRSLADHEAKLIASLTRIEVLGGDVVRLSAHNDSLHESVATARQHAAGLESRLVAAHERLRMLEGNLVELQSRLDVGAQEFSDSQKRARELETECNAARNEIADLQRQRDQALGLAERWHRDIEILCSSRSWRLTAPLRRAKASVSGAGSVIKRAVTTLMGLPGVFLQRTLLVGLAYVERQPNRKALVVRLLDRLPRLRDRLTDFAWANRNRAAVAPPVRDDSFDASVGLEGNIHWEIYPASVRDTYRQLIQARGRLRHDREGSIDGNR